jgi:phosphopantothenoylcysteine synthetase/decarboxylase
VKTILLGIAGSIAATKSPDLASRLRKAGYEVHAILTTAAAEFVTPLALQTLTRNPVTIGIFDEKETWHPGHIDLADRADLLLVAPATANILAKLALGIADDALTTIALATRAPLVIAPAMNGKMWSHPATTANVKILEDRGATFIGPEAGLLACGYEGLGRLWPVEDIVQHVTRLAEPK